MGEAYRVWTPEQIEVQYDVAGVGSRLLAGIIDHLIMFLALVLVFLGFLGLAALGSRAGTPAPVPAGPSAPTASADIVVAIMVAALFLVYAGYFVLFEWRWHGQTPGKRAIGLRVIRESGSPIGLSEAAIRNVVRLVDGLPGNAYAVGIVTMLLNRRSKRLGDFAAGTIVVKEQRGVPLGRLDQPYTVAALPGDEPLPDVSAMSEQDFALVRRYLQRRDGLSDADRRRLARNVLDAIGARVAWGAGAPPRGTDDPRLLDLVARAYRERAGTL